MGRVAADAAAETASRRAIARFRAASVMPVYLQITSSQRLLLRLMIM
jgi:hypothetical protein